jgi:hypothetical protein
MRLDLFRLGAADERASGPQPIIRIRLARRHRTRAAYRRTDVRRHSRRRWHRCHPCKRVRPTPSRLVVEKLEARTERNTVRMLGPRGHS